MQLANSTTLNDLKSDLYFIGKFNAGTFAQNDLNRIINKYYKQAQMVVRAINEDFYAVATRAVLKAGQYQQYSYPSDYEKIKIVYAALSPASTTAPLRTEFDQVTMVAPDQISNPGYNNFTAPTAITYGDYFELQNNVPTQVGVAGQEATTGGLRMVYIPLLAELSADTDVPNIFSDYHDVITWGALIDIAPRMNNDELLQRASQMFEKRKKELADYASNRIANMAGENVEGQSDGGGWSFPFGTSLVQ